MKDSTIHLDKNYNKWFSVAITYLIIAGLLGALMRYAFAAELPSWIQYKNILHAHSHVAMMGWIYSGLYIFICFLFGLNRDLYKKIFWVTQVSVVGMLISFPIQGYGLYSIFFTTLHLILSYVFIINVFRDLNQKGEKNYSSTFLRTALVFLFISTLGTWALGVIMNSSLKGGAIYYGSIQFFLHFQFNGWFIFAILGIFLKLLSQLDIIIDQKLLKRFYALLVISCVITYALAITWSTPNKFIFLTNSIGVILQFAALIYLITILKKINVPFTKKLKPWTAGLIKFAFLCLISKIVIQTLVAIPYLATVSYTIKNFVIGFIHLLMLGAVSTFLIGLNIHYTNASNINLSKIGLAIFLTGFGLSELVLFLQGIMLWQAMGFLPGYYTLLFVVSLLMPLGVIIYFLSQYTDKELI